MGLFRRSKAAPQAREEWLAAAAKLTAQARADGEGRDRWRKGRNTQRASGAYSAGYNA